MIVIAVTVGHELPDRIIPWQESDGDLIQFTTVPHTFTMKVDKAAAGATFTKTTGMVGDDTTNFTLSFTVNELDNLTPGVYPGSITARRTSDSKDRGPLPFVLLVQPAIT